MNRILLLILQLCNSCVQQKSLPPCQCAVITLPKWMTLVVCTFRQSLRISARRGISADSREQIWLDSKAKKNTTAWKTTSAIGTTVSWVYYRSFSIWILTTVSSWRGVNLGESFVFDLAFQRSIFRFHVHRLDVIFC